MATIDFLGFLGLYPDEDEEAIRARWDAWANEGREPTDEDNWTDVREGSFFYIATQPGVREAAREYDLMGTEVPMSAFVLWAWGGYLDDHGVAYALDRNPATAAEGIVRFTAPEGTVIATGSTVSVEPVDETAAAPEYEVVLGGTVDSSGFIDLDVRATETGENGNVAAGAVTIPGPGLTDVTAITNPMPIVGGTDTEDDEPYRARMIGAGAGRGGGTIADYEQWALDFTGVGRVTVIPIFAGPGTVLVIAMTADGDPVSQSVIDGLQGDLDPVAVATTLTAGETLPAATIEVGTTTGFRPPTSGHIRIGDQLVAYGGMTGTSFTGCTGGTGTFPVGEPVTQSGRGGGRAPVGHVVVVKTATALNVTVNMTIEFEEGFTLDGEGGTVPMRTVIEAAIREAVEGVPPGGEIVRQHVLGYVAILPGVHDVGALTLNGGGTNINVPGYPTPQVPTVTTFTLTQGSL
jgi:uncharacterized phage protein gp47/JayE